MLTNIEAAWFQDFRRAVTESEPDLASYYAEKALASISERLRDPNVDETERQEMIVAIHSLNLIRSNNVPVAA